MKSSSAVRFNKKARIKLAEMFWARSKEIDDQVFLESDSLEEYHENRGWRILQHFERLGCCLHYGELKFDSGPFQPDSQTLYKPSRKHLYFLLCNSNVVRLDREMAAKILVLGLP